MAFQIPNQALLSPTRQVTTTWTRPAGWITITDTPGEVQFLASDIQPTYTISTDYFGTGANMYIDWGDGVTTTISTGGVVSSTHTYTTGGTPSGLGYNTWKIRIYADSGSRIIRARVLKNSTEAATVNYPSGLLEAYYGEDTVTTMGSYFRTDETSNLMYFPNLEYVKCPNGLSEAGCFFYTFGSSSVTTSNASLARVDMPTSCSVANTLESCFQNCASLIQITLPSDMINLVSLSKTFQACRSLIKIVLPSSLSQVTTANSMCFNASNLGSIDLPEMSACLDFTSAFQACSNLLWARVKAFTSTAQSIILTSMFNNCYSLANVVFPQSVPVGTVIAGGNLFFNSNFVKFRFPTNMAASTLASAFSGNYALVSVEMPSPMPSLATASGIFQNCRSLVDVTLPSTVATINFANAFLGASSITSITIPSSWQFSSLATAFNSCSSLETVVLPQTNQPSLTLMSGAFSGCYNLKSVTLPTGLPAVTTMATCFNNCNSLQSVVLPTTMNACTTFNGTFTGCYALENLLLPNQAAAATTLTTIAADAPSMRSFTYPNKIGATATTLSESTKANCKTLTLPNDQTLAITGVTLSLTSLTELLNTAGFGAQAFNSGARVLWNSSGCYALPTLDLYCRLSGMSHAGTATVQNKLTSIRLRNTSTDQFTGIVPQIDVRYTSLDAAALNQLFTDLPVIAGKTINITGCPGAATCNRSIATAKGYTVTG